MRNGNLSLARDYFAELTTFEERIVTLQSLDSMLLGLYRMRAKPDAAGAFTHNRNVFSSVAFQRDALDFIIFGIATDNIEYLHTGIAGIRYGFDRQLLNGGFSFGPMHRRKSDFDVQLCHTALFLSAAAIAFQIVNHSCHRYRFLKPIVEIRSALRRSINRLAKHDMKLFWHDQDSTYHLMNEALVFTICSEILQDSSLQKRGRIFLDIALEMQRPDGAFLEQNGHDSSFQASTIILLFYYLLFVEQRDDFNKVLRAIGLGIKWEKSRILPSGRINAENNTRRVQTYSTFSGRINDINYSEIVKAFLFYTQFTGDLQSRTLARRIFRYIITKSHQRYDSK